MTRSFPFVLMVTNGTKRAIQSRRHLSAIEQPAQPVDATLIVNIETEGVC